MKALPIMEVNSLDKYLSLFFLFFFFLFIPTTSAWNFEGDPVTIVNPIESNGAIPINIQDQHTPLIIVYMNQVTGNSTLTTNFTIDSYNITLNDSTGVNIGDYCGVFNQENARFYTGNVLEINGNVLTMDTPSDFNFTIGNRFQYGTKEMNVDGSGTPEYFSLRADPGLLFSVDVTRIIIHITDNSAMDDGLFGGINTLTRGVVLRKKDGTYQNIFNIKNNGEFGELTFDKSYDTKAPAGLYGFTSRLTFGGQSKMGVTIRLNPDDDLQLIVQDDLTGLTSFRIMVEGHVVID